MDTTTSIKMTTLASQNLFSYVEDENLTALKVHLDKFREVDGRSDVSVLQVDSTGLACIRFTVLGLWKLALICVPLSPSTRMARLP